MKASLHTPTLVLSKSNWIQPRPRSATGPRRHSHPPWDRDNDRPPEVPRLVSPEHTSCARPPPSPPVLAITRTARHLLRIWLLGSEIGMKCLWWNASPARVGYARYLRSFSVMDVAGLFAHTYTRAKEQMRLRCVTCARFTWTLWYHLYRHSPLFLSNLISRLTSTRDSNTVSSHSRWLSTLPWIYLFYTRVFVFLRTPVE